ncbi:MAG: hypothetical protein WCI74_14445 [Actinomycetes bacterium]
MTTKRTASIMATCALVGAGMVVPAASANAATESALTAVDSQSAAALSPRGDRTGIRIGGPKAANKYAKMHFWCRAPYARRGARVNVYLNGSKLPLTRSFKVTSWGSCNFWVKSRITGRITIRMSASKGGRIWYSNVVKVRIRNIYTS